MDIRSELNGTVLDILVRAGQEVPPNTELMLIESMKMEIPITTDRAVSVISIAVEIGQSVQADELLAVVEALT